MTEAELERAVRDLIRLHGLWGYHPYDSRRSEPGWPDWCIVGRRVIFRELKTETGRLSAAQVRVRNLLVAAGADWSMWRPSDLRGGRVAAELAAVAR